MSCQNNSPLHYAGQRGITSPIEKRLISTNTYETVTKSPKRIRPTVPSPAHKINCVRADASAADLRRLYLSFTNSRPEVSYEMPIWVDVPNSGVNQSTVHADSRYSNCSSPAKISQRRLEFVKRIDTIEKLLQQQPEDDAKAICKIFKCCMRIQAESDPDIPIEALFPWIIM